MRWRTLQALERRAERLELCRRSTRRVIARESEGGGQRVHRQRAQPPEHHKPPLPFMQQATQGEGSARSAEPDEFEALWRRDAHRA